MLTSSAVGEEKLKYLKRLSKIAGERQIVPWPEVA